jgi:hypothetical protein
VEVFTSKGTTRTVIAQPGYSSNALTTGGLTNATVRGSNLYVSSNCVGTYPAGTAVGKKGKLPIRVTTQVDLQVIDLTTGKLVDAWQGTEGSGGSYTSSKVSDDEAMALLAVDSPDRSPASTIVSLGFSGGVIKSAAVGAVDPMTNAGDYVSAVIAQHFDSWLRLPGNGQLYVYLDIENNAATNTNFLGGWASAVNGIRSIQRSRFTPAHT